MRKILIGFIACLFSIPSLAQVPLGGHIVVPSSSDSITGRTYVQFTANGNCTILTQTNCTLTYDLAGTQPAGVNGMYSQILVFLDSSSFLTAPVNVYVPDAPGAKISVTNFTSQTLNIYGTGGSAFVPLAPQSFMNLASFIGGLGFNAISNCYGTPGFILEAYHNSSTYTCKTSPLDDAISNTNFITSSEGFAYSYTAIGSNNSALFLDTVSSNGNNVVYLGDNIYNINPSTLTGTLKNANLGASAIGFYHSDTTAPGCIVLYGSSNFGVSTLTHIGDFCGNGVSFSVPVAGAQPPVTQSANLAGSSRVLGTVYQNTGALAIYVQGDVITSGSVTSQVVCSDGPTSTVSQIWAATYGATVSGGFAGFSCMIPPSYYYSVSDTTGVSSLGHWFETSF